MPLRRTVRKLSSNLSIETPILVAIAGLHRIVEAMRAIAKRFMFHSSLAAPGRAFAGVGHAFAQIARYLWRLRKRREPNEREFSMSEHRGARQGPASAETA